jgi:hypothetical protein
MRAESYTNAVKRCEDLKRLTEESLNTVPKQLLYHYTTAEGAIGIISTAVLHATHSGFLNDKSEGQYASDVIARALAAYGCKTQEQRDFIAVLANAQRSPFPLYVACFCDGGDLLSQWRGYANHGGGYALGFQFWRPKPINSTAAAQEQQTVEQQGALAPPAAQYQRHRPPQHQRRDDTSAFGHFVLRKICYDEAEQFTVVHRIVSQALDVFSEAKEGFVRDKTEIKDLMDVCSGYAQKEIASFHPCFKHPSFSDEKEWRAISVSGTMEHVRPDGYRARGSEIVPYTRLCLRRRPEAAYEKLLMGLLTDIRDITIGPAAHPELAERALRLMSNTMDGVGRQICYPGLTINPSRIPFKA